MSEETQGERVVTKAKTGITEAKLQLATMVLFVMMIPISAFFFKDMHSQLKTNTEAQRAGELRDAELLSSITLLRSELESSVKLMRAELEPRIQALEESARNK